MQGVLLILIIGLKILCCKGIALASVLIAFFLKGVQLHFSSEKWEAFFLTLSEKKVQVFAKMVYFIAAAASSLLAYGLLTMLNVQYAFFIAMAMFVGGMIFTGYRWISKKKNYLLQRYQEIPATILAKREKS